tara:strand:+ start:71523 stop:71723 length:201 start_codon:yes stop_codon:yes gene_type:complete
LARACVNETQVDRAGVFGDQPLYDVLMVMDRSSPERMIDEFGLTDAPTLGMEIECDTVIAAEKVVE